MRKFALFSFNGDPRCFIHVLINALDLEEKGHEVALVVEGSATRLVKLLSVGPGLEDFEEKNPTMYRMLQEQFLTVQEAGLIGCVRQACAKQMGALEDATKVALPLCHDLKGHPSMSQYIERGYEIISFRPVLFPIGGVSLSRKVSDSQGCGQSPRMEQTVQRGFYPREDYIGGGRRTGPRSFRLEDCDSESRFPYHYRVVPAVSDRADTGRSQRPYE